MPRTGVLDLADVMEICRDQPNHHPNLPSNIPLHWAGSVMAICGLLLAACGLLDFAPAEALRGMMEKLLCQWPAECIGGSQCIGGPAAQYSNRIGLKMQDFSPKNLMAENGL